MSNNKTKTNCTVSSVRTGGKSRPSLTRAETIDSCNSDDLVTVLEVHDRKPYKIMDRRREMKKGVMAESLEELIERGKEKLNYPMEKSVYVVLEEDGTEVDEEEYFQTLPENTLLMLLHIGDKWSPFGPPFTLTKKSVSVDEPDFNLMMSGYEIDLQTLLERLSEDPGYIALMSGKELELLAEMDPDDIFGESSNCTFAKYNHAFLTIIQKAANRHLLEKNEIRDALGLLKIYHHANASTGASALEDDVNKKANLPPKKTVKAVDLDPPAAEPGKSTPGLSPINPPVGSRTRQNLVVNETMKNSVEASPRKKRKNIERKK